MGNCVTPEGLCTDPSGWKAEPSLACLGSVIPPVTLGSPKAKLTLPSGTMSRLRPGTERGRNELFPLPCMPPPLPIFTLSMLPIPTPPFRPPGHIGKQVPPWFGGMESPQHSAHYPFLVLSLGSPIWEIRVPESQGFGDALERQWVQEGRWVKQSLWPRAVTQSPQPGAQPSWGVVRPER